MTPPPTGSDLPARLRALIKLWREAAATYPDHGYGAGAAHALHRCADQLADLAAALQGSEMAHFCAACHHRWEGKQSPVELCGDCWREFQARKQQGSEMASPPQIACPACGEAVKQVASTTLDLALWQHWNWTCPKGPAKAADAPAHAPSEREHLHKLLERAVNVLDPDTNAALVEDVQAVLLRCDEAGRCVPAPAPHGWQEIASAPRDGTPILVYDEGAIVIASWVSDGDGKDGWWDMGLMQPPPTHWQPMPPPPAPDRPEER